MVRWALARSRRAFLVARWSMLLLGALPFIVPLLEHVTLTRPLGEIVRWLYGLQCHQRRVRSYDFLQASFPVCARCLGIYFGLGLCALTVRPRLRPDLYKAWILIGVLWLVLDVVTESVGLRPESAVLRSATGAFLSYGIGIAILQAFVPRWGR